MIGANPMIQAALDAGKETTGLCTVREAVDAMDVEGDDVMEMSWHDDDGELINVEIKITRHPGMIEL